MVEMLLHGELYVTIFEIYKLQYNCGINLCWQGEQTCGKRIQEQFKRTKVACQMIVGSKLYATVDLDKARVGRTLIKRHQPNNPKWIQDFHIYCAHLVSNVIFTLKGDVAIGATLIGRAYIPVEDILKESIIDRWVPILDEDHNPIQGHPKIHVNVKFVSITRDPNWSKGIQNPDFDGVPYVYFNQRKGCKVILYQDAHVSNEFSHPIFLSGVKQYEPQKCWEDIFNAILNAKHLIYITGWSVYTETTLIRDPRKQKDSNMTLGDLLKKKANEGVKVLMLVWDDRSSMGQLKEVGLMATHDEETAKYFKHTKVRCVLCPRNPEGKTSFELSTMFTHHQKTLIVDSEVFGKSGQKRSIVCFLGGLDLCDGRYDTQDHPLFKTLNTTHSQDFHQPNFDGSSIIKGGPREPWHDIHCKLEGPVAWDVLYNFEQRWRKHVGRLHIISKRELKQFTIDPSFAQIDDHDPNTWNVQIFRSIDSHAVRKFSNPNVALGLISEKDKIIDRSIQDAYINAIRRAKNFIYIENQYFLGSSYGWQSKDINVDDINALHLIPKELSLKIVSKIEAGERFSVYIVIPMWPEGKPESSSVQAILDWQTRTMEMMYTDICKTLQNKKLNIDPRNYLSFFCLGNRETMQPGEYIPVQKPEPNTNYSRAQQARRFMIYIHSKMMIVDDEYIIIGSANINQRSMDGGRDSEIAMGAFQPNHLATEQPARGQIFGFRMALWREHLGFIDNSFEYPETERCIKLVNLKADEYWNLYAREKLDYDLPGHLLRYPIDVSLNGSITPFQNIEFFPDTKARITGVKNFEAEKRF